MATRFFRDFLLGQRPDVIHFQHTRFLGYDMLRVARNTLPDVPLLPDFLRTGLRRLPEGPEHVVRVVDVDARSES